MEHGSLTILPNQFDSDFFNIKIGKIEINDEIIGLSGKDISRAVTEGNYAMVSISSTYPIQIEGALPVGELIELEGDFNAAKENLSRFTIRSIIKPIRNEDWDEVSKLLRFASETRFSLDKTFSSKDVLNHKIKMLKHYASFYPELSLGAFIDGELCGLLFCTNSNNKFHFYEVVVNPNKGMSILTVDLFQFALKQSISSGVSLSTLNTKVYRHNPVSLSFFHRIGLRDKQSTFFYHFWQTL